MSNVIDRGIVEMNFDNSDFERNVKTSMSTIEKLKSALNFDDAGNGLDNLSRAANKLDLSNISDSLDAISNRFSTMGIVAMTTVSEITKSILGGISNISKKLTDMTIQGGISRAMNIEKAKFQLNGLGVAWEEISDDIDYGVKDTAYGLDSAARVASQLVASGVQIGDDMKSSLRAISGVAAMTDSTYDEIGAIFTTVAGQGQLMTMQLRQLETRGLNAAATLAEQLGVSEAAVREMVHKGEIDFATFSKAMDSAFGEHAKDSNKTLTGTLSNIKSAFSRIGAEFIQPLIKNEGPLVELLNAIRVQVNNLKAEIVPLAKVVSDAVTRMSTFAKSVIDNINFDGVFDSAIEKAEWLYNNIESIVKMFDSTIGMISHNFSTLTKAIKEAFKEVFDGQIDIKSLSKKFVEFNNKLKITEKGMQNLKNVFKLAFSIVKGGINLIKRLYTIAKNGLKVLKTTASKMFDVVGALSGTINETRNVGSVIESVLGNIENIITSVFNNFSEFLDSVQNGESILESALHLLENTVKDVTVTIIKNIEDVIFELTGIDVHILSDLVSKIFGYAWSKIDEFIDNFKNGGGLQGAINVFWGILKDLGNLILKKFEEVTGIDLSDFKKTVSDATDEIKDKLNTWLASFKPLDTIGDKITRVSNAVSGLSDNLKTLKDSAVIGLSKILENPFLTLDALLNNQVLTNFSMLAKNLQDPTGIIGTLNSLKRTLLGLTNDLKITKLALLATTIIAFAIGVSILAGSIAKLTGVEDWKDGLASIGTIITLLIGLVSSFVIVSKIIAPSIQTFSKNTNSFFGLFSKKSFTKNVSASSASIVLASLAILVIAKSLKTVVEALADVDELMKENDPERVLDDLLIVIGALATLILAFEGLSLMISGLKIKTGTIIKVLLVAESMKILGEAINIMADALNSLNDITSVGQALGKLGEIFGLMIALIGGEVILQLTGISGKVVLAAAGMVLFAVAIKKLVEAMNVLDQADPLKMTTAFGVVLLLMTKLANSVFLMGNRKVMLSTAISLLAIAYSVKILTDCLEKLGSMSIDELAKGFLFLEGILTSFTIVVKTFQQEMKGAIGGAVAFIAMAASIYIIAKAINVLRGLDPESLLMSISSLLITVYALGKIAEEAEDNLAGAASILILAAALAVVAYSLKMIANCKPLTIFADVLLLVGALGLLTALASVLKDNLKGAGTLAILAVSILLVAEALKVVAAIPFKDLLKGAVIIIAFIAVLGGLAVAAAAIGTEILAGAAIIAGALALIGVGIAAIAGSLLLMDLAFNGIAASGAGCAEAFKMLAETIIYLGKEFFKYHQEIDTFKTLMSNLAWICLGLGAAFLVLGVGAAVGAVGLAALAVVGLVLALAITAVSGGLALFNGVALTAALAITALSAAALTSTVGITALAAEMLILLVPSLAMAVAALALGVGLGVLAVGALAASVGIAALAVAVGLLAVALAGIAALFTPFIEAIGASAEDGIGDMSGIGEKGASSIVEGFERGMDNGLVVVTAASTTFALTVKDALQKAIDSILISVGEMGTKVGVSFSNGLSKAMTGSLEEGKKNVQYAGDSLKDLTQKYGENSGMYMGAGYHNGLVKQRGAIMNTAASIARSAYMAMRSYLKINSPSKMTEELGKWTDLGFVRGMDKNSNAVESSANDVAETAVDSLSTGLQAAYDNLGSEIEDPVIKPVIDMSDVQNGSSKINSMFGKDYASSISANYKSNGQLIEEANMANAGLMNALNGQLVNAINANGNGQVPVNVNVTLAGDAEGLFRVILNENTRLTKANGYSPLLR